MTYTQSLAIHIVTAVAVGVALDWAIFERFKMIVGAFGDSGEVRYRELPSWRVVVVILASAIVGISLAAQVLLAFPFWIGTALFVMSNIYANAVALRR
jgi:hypothetical protein